MAPRISVPIRLALLVLCGLAGACGPLDEGERGVREIDPPSRSEIEAELALDDALRWIAAEEFERARGPLEQVVELQPEHAEAREQLGGVLLALGEGDAGRAELVRAIELDPERADARDRLGRSLLDAGRLDQAEAVFREWAERDPESAAAFEGLGRTRRERGDLEGARQAFKRATRNRPGDGALRSELGAVLLALDKAEAAERSQREALDLDASDHVAWTRLAIVLDRAGPERADEALQAAARAVELSPRNGRARLIHAALLRRRAGEGPEAAKKADRALKRVLTAQHEEQVPWFGLRARPEPRENARRAERRLRAAVETAPDDAAAHRALAGFLHHGGDVADAIPSYERARELDAGLPDLNARLGAAWAFLGDTARAVPFLDAALAAEPDDAHTLRLRAWCALQNGQADAALGLYARTLELRPTDKRAERGRALAWLGLGNVDDALAVLDPVSAGR